MIGVKPLFSGRSLGEGENAGFDVIVASPKGTSLAQKGLRYELLKVETKYQWYRREGGLGLRACEVDAARRRRDRSTSPPTSLRASRCPCSGDATVSKW